MGGTTETAILAGGCFWGMQDLIRKRPGVLSTRVGYSGGDVPNATYRNHGNHVGGAGFVEEVGHALACPASAARPRREETLNS